MLKHRQQKKDTLFMMKRNNTSIHWKLLQNCGNCPQVGAWPDKKRMDDYFTKKWQQDECHGYTQWRTRKETAWIDERIYWILP
jgi:hypothetical protein